MDLRVEWDAEGVGRIFEDPENHLHPFAPDFSRWIEVLGRRGEVHGPVGELPECERRVLSAEGVGSVLAVPVFVGPDWWGFLGFDDAREERRWSEVEIGALRATAGALGVAIERQRTEETLRFTEQQYRSIVEHIPAITYIDAVNEQASSIYVSPQIEAVLGYSQQEWLADPDLWPRTHPPRRSCSRPGGERASQRDRGAVRAGVPDVREGRPGGVGVRPGHAGARRARRAAVLPRRAPGHLGAEAAGGARRVPGVPRRADRPAEPVDVRGAAEPVDRPGAAPRRVGRGRLPRPRRFRAGQRQPRSSPRGRAPEDGGGSTARIHARDRSGRASRERSVPVVARRHGTRGTRRHGRGDDPRRGGRAAHPRVVDVAVRRRVDRALHLGQHGHQPLPPGRERSGRIAPQRRGRDVREQEVGPGRLRRVGARRGRLFGEAAVRDQAPQGGRAPPVGPALPTGHRARHRPDDGRRGVDPMDRARRHDDPAGGVHPARRGARTDRDDRGLGGERGRLPVPRVDGPGHRPRDRVQPFAQAVLAAGPGREDPRADRQRRRGPDEDRGRGHRVVRVDRSRSRAGDPVGAPPRRTPRGDRRLRHRLFVVVAAALRPDRSAQDRPVVRLGGRPGSAGGEHRDRVHRARRGVGDDDAGRGDRDPRRARLPDRPWLPDGSGIPVQPPGATRGDHRVRARRRARRHARAADLRERRPDPFDDRRFVDACPGAQLRGRAGAGHLRHAQLDDPARERTGRGQRIQHRVADAAFDPVVLDDDDRCRSPRAPSATSSRRSASRNSSRSPAP